MAMTSEERRERRAVKKDIEQRRENSDQADLIARANAYGIIWRMEQVKRGEPMPKSWAFYTAGHLFSECRIIAESYTPCRFTTVEYRGVYREPGELEAKLELQMPGRFIGSIQNGTGRTMAVVFDVDDGRGAITYATGDYKGERTIVEVCGFDYSTVRVRGLES